MAAIDDRRHEVGDQLELLYGEHGGRVRAICFSLLRDQQEAEDAAQQVFLSALRSLHSGTAPRDAGAWLATIARRECWARARRPEVAPLHAGLLDAKAEDPSTSALSRAELDETWRTVAGLPGRQREALLLREVRGLGYDELAEDMQLSRPSVRSLLTRARRTLRAQLERGTAVVTGGPWLSMAPRLFADGSNPVLSSVGRSAAVGLGAVAITGGAVVAPRLVAPSHAHQTARAAVPHKARVTRRPPGLASAVVARMHDMARLVEPASTTERLGGRSGGGSERGHDAGSMGESSSGSGSSWRDGGAEVSVSSESSVTSLSGSGGGPGPDTSSSSSGSGSRDSSEEPSTRITTVTTVSSSDGVDGVSGSSGSDGSGSSSGSGSSDGGSPDGGSFGSDGGH